MSQDALGAELGVNQGTVSKWERGEAEIGSTMMMRLAAFFSIPVQDLYEGDFPDI